MKTNYELRYATNPYDVNNYETERLRKEFLIEKLFTSDEINIIYLMESRFVIGGICPVKETLELESISPLNSQYFLENREIGIINVGGIGIVIVDNIEYELDYKEMLYVGLGKKQVFFKSKDINQPAKFYINSSVSNLSINDKKIEKQDIKKQEVGSQETANYKVINRLISSDDKQSCQLKMDLIELKPGSVWNNIPPQAHERRNGVYFYFEIPEGDFICHFTGVPESTKHIWLEAEQAVVSPEWAVNSAVGTRRYALIYGSGGTDMDYGDRDFYEYTQLK